MYCYLNRIVVKKYITGGQTADFPFFVRLSFTLSFWLIWWYIACLLLWIIEQYLFLSLSHLILLLIISLQFIDIIPLMFINWMMDLSLIKPNLVQNSYAKLFELWSAWRGQRFTSFITNFIVIYIDVAVLNYRKVRFVHFAWLR